MSKRLTEEMVIARTKISDLSKIKRLNCWGSELVDVSLLRNMPSVEVLSLSINKINSLCDFQFCKRLEELYIRQNDIRDLNEIVFLQSLPNLKNLWLGENPCANVEGYRLAVLKALPQLQKLDNVQVTADEVKDASRRGRTLVNPQDSDGAPEEDYQEDEEEEYPQQQYRTGYAQPQQQQYQEEFVSEEIEDYPEVERVLEENKSRSPPRQASPPRRAEPLPRKNYSPEPVYSEPRRNSYERESSKQQPQYYDRCPLSAVGDICPYEDNNVICDNINNTREVKIVNSQSTSCIKEYANGDRYVHYRTNESEASSAHGGHDRRERHSCPVPAHTRPPFARRPVTRNSNILSAVLRLVKELDYPSLEVVEMEVRSRMDELDE